MKIWSYSFAFPDEIDILGNCLNSLSRCADKIILVDGGMNHAFVHQARNSEPIRDWIKRQPEYSFTGYVGVSSRQTWNNIPIVLLEHEYVDPGSQRNFILQWISEQSDKPDWVIALDADEVESLEAETGMRDYLESLPPQVTNVVQPLLNLIQDEKHCAAGHHSDWLAHSRLHRPGAVHFNLGYHEHQTYQGVRVQWNARIIHQRMLYRRRIWLQRGAYTLRSAWNDVQMVYIPEGVTWRPLVWPEREYPIPFDEDIRYFSGGAMSE
jgi:hypothetical protein